MATHGRGGVRRLVLRVKKVWRQVTRRKSSRNTEEEHGMKVNIPNDVIFEILLRLPAKSLLRFRWACKYWFDLITRDHNFIKMHLHYSTTHHDGYLSFISTSNRSIRCCNVDYSKNGTCRHHVSSELNIALRFEQLKILGVCNGLILLRELGRKTLCILNPCTEEYRILPNPLSEVDRPLAENYGFGYDRKIDDYKVIRKLYCYHDNDRYSDVEVYTLGTNSWRIIEPKCNRAFMETVFVNGSLYWMDNLSRDINCFDIEKEQQFHNVPITPKIADRYWRTDMKLEVFEGSLCGVVQFRDQQVYHVEMWMMKDYTMNNNISENLWTKLTTIPDLREFELPLKPLRYTRNGEILMLSNHKDLVLHDPMNNKNRTTLGRICEYPCYNIVKTVYTEGLVSLNSGTYTGQERREEQKP